MNARACVRYTFNRSIKIKNTEKKIYCNYIHTTHVQIYVYLDGGLLINIITRPVVGGATGKKKFRNRVVNVCLCVYALCEGIILYVLLPVDRYVYINI